MIMDQFLLYCSWAWKFAWSLKVQCPTILYNNIVPVLPPTSTWTPFMDNLKHFNYRNHSRSMLLPPSYTRKALIFHRNVPFPPFSQFFNFSCLGIPPQCMFQCCPLKDPAWAICKHCSSFICSGKLTPTKGLKIHRFSSFKALAVCFCPCRISRRFCD